MEGGGEEEAQRGREDEALGETVGERQGPCERGAKNQGVLNVLRSSPVT